MIRQTLKNSMLEIRSRHYEHARDFDATIAGYKELLRTANNNDEIILVKSAIASVLQEAQRWRDACVIWEELSPLPMTDEMKARVFQNKSIGLFFCDQYDEARVACDTAITYAKRAGHQQLLAQLLENRTGLSNPATKDRSIIIRHRLPDVDKRIEDKDA